MYALVFAALAVSPAQPSTKHDDQNPLFKSLIDTGLTVDKQTFKFPAPTMPDGLDATKQKETITKLIDGQYTYENFTRQSVQAPRVLKITDLKKNDPNAIPRAVDVSFVAYGDFKLLQDDKFLDRLMSSGNKGNNGKSGDLKPADLEKRKIMIAKGNEKRESYGFVEFDFLGTVRLKATGHAMWSRNDESVLAAAEIDPRFLNDKEFPNEWRPLSAGKAGDPQPWNGAAMYLKITKLKEPEGALFIEQHIIFVEPRGWFGGEGQLRSKLPAAVQDSATTMRRELLKGK
jgi:hypothetical protein